MLKYQYSATFGYSLFARIFAAEMLRGNFEY